MFVLGLMLWLCLGWFVVVYGGWISVCGFAVVVLVGGFSWWFVYSWLWICLALLGLFGLRMLFTVKVVVPAVGGLIWCVADADCIYLRCWCLFGLLLALVWCYWFGCWNVLFPIGQVWFSCLLCCLPCTVELLCLLSYCAVCVGGFRWFLVLVVGCYWWLRLVVFFGLICLVVVWLVVTWLWFGWWVGCLFG